MSAADETERGAPAWFGGGRVVAYGGHVPRAAGRVFVAEGAHVIGDVVLGADASVWFNTVVRGDVHRIRIGARTNVQDLTMCHVSSGTHPLTIGADVTIGHGVIVHGCTIGDRVLVGMGSIVLDGAVIEDDVLLGAGALVTPGTRIPSGVLAIGQPARPKRPLTDEERASLVASAAHYVRVARSHQPTATPPAGREPRSQRP
jgi:carbonic anhydrase/acetyltransferase-like protein (isoleucine patch superfamily)